MNVLDTYNRTEIIHYVLKQMGVGPHLKGYRYCTKAIELALSDAAYLDDVTRRMYAEVAKEFNTTASCAERAIRHAITYALDNSGADDWAYTVFGRFALKGMVCNSLFIAMCVDLIANEPHHPIFIMEVPNEQKQHKA